MGRGGISEWKSSVAAMRRFLCGTSATEVLADGSTLNKISVTLMAQTCDIQRTMFCVYTVEAKPKNGKRKEKRPIGFQRIRWPFSFEKVVRFLTPDAALFLDRCGLVSQASPTLSLFAVSRQQTLLSQGSWLVWDLTPNQFLSVRLSIARTVPKLRFVARFSCVRRVCSVVSLLV